MSLHGDFANIKLGANLFIKQSTYHQIHHFKLVRRERVSAVPETAHLALLAES